MERHQCEVLLLCYLFVFFCFVFPLFTSLLTGGVGTALQLWTVSSTGLLPVAGDQSTAQALLLCRQGLQSLSDLPGPPDLLLRHPADPPLHQVSCSACPNLLETPVYLVKRRETKVKSSSLYADYVLWHLIDVKHWLWRCRTCVFIFYDQFTLLSSSHEETPRKSTTSVILQLNWAAKPARFTVFRSNNLTLLYLILSTASSSNGSAPLESSDGQSGSDTPVRTLASGSSSAPETSPSASSDRNAASASGAAATRQPSSSVTPALPPRVPAVNAGPLPPGSALMMLSLQKGI